MGLWDFINSATDKVKQNTPNLSPVTAACRSTYNFTWTAVTKFNSVMGNVVPTVNQYAPDEEGRAKINRFATNFVKNAAVEGIKWVPGGEFVYKIASRSLRDEITEDHKVEVEKLHARIDRLERESSGGKNIQADVKFEGESSGGKNIQADVIFEGESSGGKNIQADVIFEGEFSVGMKTVNHKEEVKKLHARIDRLERESGGGKNIQADVKFERESNAGKNNQTEAKFGSQIAPCLNSNLHQEPEDVIRIFMMEFGGRYMFDNLVVPGAQLGKKSRKEP